MNWTEEMVAQHMANMQGYSKGGSFACEVPKDDPRPSAPVPIIPKDPMNKTERSFANHCEMRKHLREILDWMFEPFKLILVPGIPGGRNEVTYKPDFLVITPKEFEVVEVKAKRGDWTSMRDDARVKVNIASGKFPWFRFKVAYLEGGTWTFEKVN